LKEIGLYLNFPFCIKKCKYCDFHSYDNMTHYMPKYIDALKTEISSYEKILSGYAIKSIYMGGGTPTIIHEDVLKEVLDICRQVFDISPVAEVTIEANPATLDKRKLSILRSAGVNRISVGLQAWQHKHLKTLGRAHTPDDYTNAVDWAKREGFDNISTDIMFSLPDQTLQELLETTTIVCEMKVSHVSLYGLRLEENTPLFDSFARKEIDVPDDEEDRAMFHWAKKLLHEHGLKRYEISNFALEEKECVHNLIYWNNEEYIGCGSAAHSYFKGERFSNQTDIEKYIKSVFQNDGSIREHVKKVDEKAQRFETMMLGLRLVQGIDKEAFRLRFGNDVSFFYNSAIDLLIAQELLQEDRGRLFCTEKGMDLNNQVLIKFLD